LAYLNIQSIVHNFLFDFRLQRQLNNALQQAGIYTINMTIFGVEEAVDNLG
jgi:predicted nuclease of predicted toxin-antitoxin system